MAIHLVLIFIDALTAILQYVEKDSSLQGHAQRLLITYISSCCRRFQRFPGVCQYFPYLSDYLYLLRSLDVEFSLILAAALTITACQFLPRTFTDGILLAVHSQKVRPLNSVFSVRNLMSDRCSIFRLQNFPTDVACLFLSLLTFSHHHDVYPHRRSFNRHALYCRRAI